MKKLVTDRLILRQWKDIDLEKFHEYCKNPKIGSRAGWKPHTSIEESRQVLDSFIEKDDVWAVVVKDGGKLIGSVGLHYGDPSRPNIDGVYNLGFVQDEKFWGNGYMYEACREVIRYAFEEMHVEMLSTKHFTFNKECKRVIEKCGFTREGVRRKGFKRLYDDKILDVVCYSMIPAEFSVNHNVNHSEEADQEEKFSVVHMSAENAYDCVEWKYPVPMDVYNCLPQNYEANVQKIINKSSGNEHFAVYNSLGEFFGVYAYKFLEDGTLEGEFRVHPDKMGRGFTKSFVKNCINFARDNYSYNGDLIMRVPEANTRGIVLLKRRGATQLVTTEEQFNNTTVTKVVYLKLKAE